MSDPRSEMSVERFASLAAAYGGDLRRWPAADQAAAGGLARTQSGLAILQREGRLDPLLDGYRAPDPSPALHARILGQASVQKARHRRLFLWRSGLGFAGVGLAGALAGMVAAAILMPSPRPDHYVFSANTTAFGDVASDKDVAEERL